MKTAVTANFSREQLLLFACAVKLCSAKMFQLLNSQSQIGRVNPLSPHDALKHHFTSLKTDLIFLQLGVLE